MPKMSLPYTLKRMRLADLKPHPKQKKTRQITDEALTGLKGSLDRFGVLEEIIVNAKTGHVLSGHQRWKILAAENGTKAVPVKVVNVSKNEEDAIFWTLNNPAICGEYTPEAKVELQKLEVYLEEMYVDVGLKALEISLPDLPEEPKDGLTDPDDVPEVTKTKIKTGDLYQLGNHRLLCGDATKAEDVERVLASDKPFMMVTDPPYGEDYDPEWRKRNGLIRFGRMGKVSNDNQVDWSKALGLHSGDVVYIWHSARFAHVVAASIESLDYDIRTQIIWRKQHFAISRGHYHWQHEPCWYAVRKGAKAYWAGDRTQSTVWDIASLQSYTSQEEHTDHGTQKPIECMARPIRNHGKKGDGIYDPFLGSGTTMIACEQLDRNCYGIEISPQYVGVVIERWQNFTGKAAILLETGQSYDELKNGGKRAKR